MAFKFFLSFKYSHTHENRIWNKLINDLNLKYDGLKEKVYLIGNLIANGKEIDAILIKEDAIIVIDFKDYGGDLIISENEPWTVSGIEINSNRKNPFVQLSDNKYAVLDVLKKKLPEGYESWINIGHINALVLFHQNINYNLENIKIDLSQSASMWFGVCDPTDFLVRVDEIVSKQTFLRNERFSIVIEALGVAIEKFDYTENTTPKDIEAKAEGLVQNFEQSFAEIYYKAAKEIKSINFLIVGQDPYPNGANGVAFCKDSYYALFVEEPEPSGATVLRSMGIDMEKARLISRKNPKSLFYELLTKYGICFINVFDEVYDKISLEDRISVAKQTAAFNLPIVEKSKTIILLGKGKTKDTFEAHYRGISYDHVLIHPSAKAKEANPTEWCDVWEKNFLETLSFPS